jgi:hypothetical protein
MPHTLAVCAETSAMFYFAHKGQPSHIAPRRFRKERGVLLRHRISVPLFVYLAIGVFVAWSRSYLDVPLLRAIGSALLAIILWFLVLLGVDLHIHG